MNKPWLGFVLAACLVSSAFAQNNRHVQLMRPFGQHQDIDPAALTISYFGGPVMLGTANTAYVVYYGAWTQKSRGIVNTYLKHIGGSTMYNINTTYFDSTKTHIQNVLLYDPALDSTVDNYSMGKNLSDSQVQQIVAKAITNHKLPDDPNGVYFVLTWTDVTESAFGGTFCSLFCGYHSPSTSIVRGETIKYSFVGNAATQCPSGCVASKVLGDSSSPNGDPGADGVVNVLWHELSETVTDPEVNLHTAWTGSCGENGDCCAWNFGRTFITGNGSHANQRIGGRPYIAQLMLKLTDEIVGTDPGVCARVLP